MDGSATVVPRHELMNVQAVTQLEKDTILVCYDSECCFSCLLKSQKSFRFLFADVVKVVNLQGKLKSSKRQASELHFDFTITAVGKILNQTFNTVVTAKIHGIFQCAWPTASSPSTSTACRAGASRTAKLRKRSATDRGYSSCWALTGNTI